MSAPERPRAYSYIRMSTDLQLRGDSLRRQLEASTAYAAANGLDLVADDRLQDIGISAFKGANVAGGSLGKFLEAADSGKVPRGSFLLVESLDRLSRQEIHKSLTLFLSIINAGINIVTLADSRVYTAENPQLQDLLISLVVMSRAHEESHTKSLRVGAAWANKRARAKTQPLTAMCPAWLKLSKDRARYEVIDKRAATIRRIFEESAAGIGNYSITKRLNNQKVPHFGKSDGWHLSYIAKILKNRAVIGEFQPHRLISGKRQPDGDVIQSYFPAVVDEDTFYRAQLGLAQRLNHGAGRKGTTLTNIFSGVAKCAYCGAPMKFENKGKPPKGATFLVCYNAQRGLGCEIARWRYDEFEASFLAFVRELDLSQVLGNADESKAKSLDEIIAALSGELMAVVTLREKTYEVWSQARDAQTFLASKLDELERRRAEIERALDQKRNERLALDAEMKSVQQSQDDVKEMLEALKTTQGDELYKLRAKIAGRIRTICTFVRVAPLGLAPQSKHAVDALQRQENKRFASVLTKLKQRSFAVGFRDGTTRIVRPSDDDPLQFEEQVYVDSSGLKTIAPSGDERLLFPGDLTTQS